MVIRFDIDSAGKPEHAEAVLACPELFFDQAALTAVQSWSYPPEQADQKGVRVRMTFDGDAP